MPALLKNLTIHEISLVDEPANDEARVVIVKARRPFNLAAAAADSQETDMADMDAIQAALAEAEEQITELAKARDTEADRAKAAEGRVAELEAALAAKDQEIAKARSAIMTPEEAEQEFLKSLPEAARKRLVEAEEALQKARAKEEEDAAIAKARAFAPGDEEAREIGGLLLRVEKGKTTPDDAKRLETILKGARALSGKLDFFKSLGAAGAGEAEIDDPEKALQAKADEIAKAKPDLTSAQAYAEAMAQNPGLYNAYVAKRRSRPAAA